MNVAPGEQIIEQGEEGDSFYAIWSGQVDVVKDERLVTTIGPGSYFGEVALLMDVPRTATVVARTPAAALPAGPGGFEQAGRWSVPAGDARSSHVGRTSQH